VSYRPSLAAPFPSSLVSCGRSISCLLLIVSSSPYSPLLFLPSPPPLPPPPLLLLLLLLVPGALRGKVEGHHIHDQQAGPGGHRGHAVRLRCGASDRGMVFKGLDLGVQGMRVGGGKGQCCTDLYCSSTQDGSAVLCEYYDPYLAGAHPHEERCTRFRDRNIRRFFFFFFGSSAILTLTFSVFLLCFSAKSSFPGAGVWEQRRPGDPSQCHPGGAVGYSDNLSISH